MDDMSFTEALENVYELAKSNVFDERDIAFGDAGLAAQREQQIAALNTLHDLILNHEDDIDALAPSKESQDWPKDSWLPQTEIDATSPGNAIRICLSMAEACAIYPEDCGRDMDLADECDIQQQAFDVVRDLIGMHGRELDNIHRIDISPLMP